MKKGTLITTSGGLKSENCDPHWSQCEVGVRGAAAHLLQLLSRQDPGCTYRPISNCMLLNYEKERWMESLLLSSNMRIKFKLSVELVMTYQGTFIQGYNLYCAFVCKLQKSSDNLRSSCH